MGGRGRQRKGEQAELIGRWGLRGRGGMCDGMSDGGSTTEKTENKERKLNTG